MDNLPPIVMRRRDLALVLSEATGKPFAKCLDRIGNFSKEGLLFVSSQRGERCWREYGLIDCVTAYACDVMRDQVMPQQAYAAVVAALQSYRDGSCRADAILSAVMTGEPVTEVFRLSAISSIEIDFAPLEKVFARGFWVASKGEVARG